jgi:Ca2+-binding RTX toxin-like protein
MREGHSPSNSNMMQQLESRAYFSTFAPVIAPTDVAATPLSSNSIKLTWSDNSPNEVNFFVFRSTDGTHYSKVISTGVFAESWTDTTVQPATTYFYKVQAHALTADSTQSAAASTTTPATTPFAVLDSTTGQLVVNGTSGSDHITLSATAGSLIVKRNTSTLTFTQSDVKRISVYAFSGNDEVAINAGVGAVYISGGDGNDTLLGNTGNDRIDGGAGNDLIKGNDGDDTVTGGDGDDTLYGQAGNDYLEGDNGNDKIVGGDGNDAIYGNAGNDRLYGQGGIDTIVGGAGSNFIVPD